MTILYISYLTSNIAAGLAWSVPASVDAQSNIDDVLWVNDSDAFIPHWAKVKAYHNVSDYGKLKLECFPVPFNHPDLVVFEGFNFIRHALFAIRVRREKIPYIIVPRGALTYEAQHNHAMWKKKIANFMFLKRFVSKASAIQFLTKGERDKSTAYNKICNFILPNGFNDPKVHKECFSENEIKATFIGRLDIYHKGLDILLNVLEKNKEALEQHNFHLSIYGPKRYDYYKIKEIISEKKIESLVSILDEVSGKMKEDVLLQTDLFIMTSRLEGHPMGLIEALAYGIPCFITRGTNMYDEVKESMCGWTCETDELSIESTILKMINEVDTFSLKSIKARELARQYQWNKIAVCFHNKIVELKLVNDKILR